MIAVVATFHIQPDQIGQFLPLMQTNARTSLAQEPQCHQFDVWTDPLRPHEVLLYELYTDRDAFQAHLDSAHFKTFDAQTAPMIAQKDVRIYTHAQV